MNLKENLRGFLMRLHQVIQKRRKRNPITRIYQKLARRAREANKLSRRVTTSYPTWLQHFDTPPRALIDRWTTEAGDRTPVRIVAHFDRRSVCHAMPLVERLLQSEGQPWTALFLFDDESGSSIDADQVRLAARNEPRICLEKDQLGANADMTILIEGGALPRTHALRVFADCLRKTDQALIAYSDEDDIDEQGIVQSPWFKPAYSPLLIRQGALLGRIVAIKDATSTGQHNWLALCANSLNIRDYCISLAMAATPASVLHIPHVLFSDRLGHRPLIPLDIPPPKAWPTASVIIPTRDRWDLLGPCLTSIHASDWPQDLLEIIVVDNGSTDQQTVTELARLRDSGKIRLFPCEEAFNWARLNNLAASSARGEVLVFLNNDTKVIDAGWLTKLASHAMQPGVGAVGCKLLYADRTVQHGGVIAGIQGVTAHAHLHLKDSEGGYRGLANVTHEVSAVTGACLAVRREYFELVGGFNESFKIAFSDAIFCFDLLKKGFRNIYVADPLLLHFESKTRGYDDTAKKMAVFRDEATRTWRDYAHFMRDDPYYSPNLSLKAPYELSFAPRRRAAWYDPDSRPLRIMMLSSTHAIGHGVPVVMALQAEALRSAGHEVFVAGPRTERDFPYPGCRRIEVEDAIEATACAADLGIDVMIAETPPFFSVARWTGNYPRVLCYDHGEPPPDWFPDSGDRKAVLAEKDFALRMAHAVYAISEAIANESRTPVHGIIPEGNTHLGRWSEASHAKRTQTRQAQGWGDDCYVVLSVCRFHRGERVYKGVETYAALHAAMSRKKLANSKKRAVFVLCGKGTPEDVKEMQALGLTVFANVSNEEMANLYCAADAYASFSRWEGFNLGVAQALAMGLPTIGSAIPAHLAFGIPVTDDVEEATQWLGGEMAIDRERQPRLMDWKPALERFVSAVEVLALGDDNFRTGTRNPNTAGLYSKT